MFAMQNIFFSKKKNTDPKNQIFLFCRPTDPIFFAVLPLDQKINLVSCNAFHVLVGSFFEIKLL